MKAVKVLGTALLCVSVVGLMGAVPPSNPGNLKTSRTDSTSNAKSFVGSWTCSASKSEELPQGQGKLTMSVKDSPTFSNDGKVRASGKMTLKSPKFEAKWTMQGVGSWRLAGGEFCSTLAELTMEAANADARRLEEQMGRSMADSIPKGEESCEEIVEVSATRYVTKDKKAGVITRCTRK
jgi:hypothetical protein